MTRDVIFAIQNAGYDIDSKPTSKRDLQKVQDAFNSWHDETGLCYTSLSRIAAFSVNINHETGMIKREVKKIIIM